MVSGLALAGGEEAGRDSGRRVRGQPDCAELSEEGGGIGGNTGIWIEGPGGRVLELGNEKENSVVIDIHA